MGLYVYLHLVSLLYLTCTVLGGPAPQGRRAANRFPARAASRAAGQCEVVASPLCQDVGYNMTMLPNMFGHELQRDAVTELQSFQPLIQIDCARHLAFFLCTAYLPVCTILDDPVLPCRDVCESVRDGCQPIMNRFGFEWPEQLACDRFPGSEQICASASSAETARDDAVNNNHAQHDMAVNDGDAAQHVEDAQGGSDAQEVGGEGVTEVVGGEAGGGEYVSEGADNTSVVEGEAHAEHQEVNTLAQQVLEKQLLVSALQLQKLQLEIHKLELELEQMEEE